MWGAAKRTWSPLAVIRTKAERKLLVYANFQL